ncbi:hypothetical protein [Candidatus Tisiphia endosymbiont of Beris chalybata]|uniref:hypothetical protein n=1 Tax=Candidatus Tisiphia endosymbiont of Beris chalybata TaxID=3066262 RepID=UPI00312C7BE9
MQEVYLSFEDIFKVIANFKKSGATYLLTTTFVNRESNNALVGADSFGRTLNLQQKPFNFPEPILLLNTGSPQDNDLYRDKSLGLWYLKDITLPKEWY